MALTWTRVQDGSHNGKPCYDYHAKSGDITYHITWAISAGFGYTATRKNSHDGCTEFLSPTGRHVHTITWARTLKHCKAMCEEIEIKFTTPAPTPALVPNIVGSFKDFDDWVRHATRVLANKTCETSGCTIPVPAMCVDTKGRRCYQGGDFDRARREGTYPISYFWDCK